jgi:hypothetical protein
MLGGNFVSVSSILRRRYAAAAVRAFGAERAHELDARIALSRRSLAGIAAYETRQQLDTAAIADYYNARNVNTRPDDYVLRLKAVPSAGPSSRSNRIVDLLRQADARIAPGREFHASVRNAIFDDALRLHYMNDEPFASAVYARAIRRWGKQSTRIRVGHCCEALITWNECKFVPDAYLIDAERASIVCYEIEDTHPINHSSILAYGYAWWALNEIYWDLHLIAYDIYGHARIYRFPEADLIAQVHERGKLATADAFARARE